MLLEILRNPDMPDIQSTEVLTVLYDGACPLCRREISHVQNLAAARPESALSFVDISAGSASEARYAADRDILLARFHVQREDGSRLSGAAAFVAMWARLPGWRWIARMARLPGALMMLEWAYLGFLRVRPLLQSFTRRICSDRTC